MFTDKKIRSEKATQSVRRVWEGSGDPQLKGFGLVIAPSGSKSFCIYYSSPETSQRRMLNLGKYPSVTLSEARAVCRQARTLIDKGVDPIEARKRDDEIEGLRLSKKANQGTVAQLFNLYIDDLKLNGKRSSHNVRKIFEHDISPFIGYLHASVITKDDCSDIIARVAARGALVQANRVRSYILAAFNFGLICNDIPQWRGKTPDFSLLYNPAAQTQKAIKKEAAGTRYLTKEEIAKLWASIGVEAMHPDLALVLKLMLSTGQRVEEVIQAEWSEFNLEDKVWTIPGARRKTRDKQSEPHIVPLTDFHISLLADITRRGSWLFPHLDGKQPRKYDALTQAVSRYCTAMGFEKFTPRDLRRTWKTMAGSIGLDLEIRNRIQGHAFQDIGSKSYDQFDYLDKKRAAMGEWTAWLAAVVSNQKMEAFAHESL